MPGCAWLAVHPPWTSRRLVLVVVIAAAVVGLVPQFSSASELKTRSSALRRITAGRAIDEKYFEPGACIEFPPTFGNRHRIVFVDAGHGGLDPGGVGETESGQTIYEADETLPVELAAMKLLRARGFTVVVSRTDAETVVRPSPATSRGVSLRSRASTTTLQPGTSAPIWRRQTSSWGSTSTPVAPRITPAP